MKKITTLLFIAIVMLYANAAIAQFTANGERLTYVLQEDWKVNGTTGVGAWRNQSRENYTYPSGTSANIVIDSFTTAGAWSKSGQYIFTTTSTGAISSFVAQSWVAASNTWKNYYRINYTYVNNDPNKPSFEFAETADPTGSTWSPFSQRFYTYSSSFLAEELYKTYTNGVSQPQSKTIYPVPAQYPAEKQEQTYSTLTATWDNATKTLYTYNTTNQVASETELYYYAADGSYVNNKRTNNTYTNGDLATVLTSSYAEDVDTVTGAPIPIWLPTDRELRTYNPAHAELTNRQQRTNDNGASYYDDRTIDYTLNAANNPIVALHKKLVSSGSLINNYRRTAQYAVVTATDAVAPNAVAFQVFPNPASDNITLSRDTDGVGVLYITNEIGQVVKLQNVISAQESISLQAFPAGSYRISVLQNGNIATKTVVKF